MAGHHRPTTAIVLLGAGALGVTVGVGSVGPTPQGDGRVDSVTRQLAGASGLRRQRLPQQGDNWGGCNDARVAGTAPIYRGEPGYRDDMDGDDDGIACETPRS